MVISYEINETSIWRGSLISYDSVYHMTRLIGFRRLQNEDYFNVDMDVVNDVTCTRQSVITRVIIRFL